MKNIEQIAKESRKGTKIYYSFNENAIYTEAGDGRFYVTELLRKNTAEEIKSVIRRWMVL